MLSKSLAVLTLLAAAIAPATAQTRNGYTPTPENIAARQEFADHGLGIFIHWGIYSMFGNGEWYLNGGLNAKEYAKAAGGFYPAGFDAKEWVDAIKAAGAKYICITSRHHDGFSMFHTKYSDYNIVDATPFKRDVLAELADECHRQGIKLHFYYSHTDWTREDYPAGTHGHNTGRDASKADFDSYYTFMNNQLTELLTNYGEIGAIWFDGMWDHDVLKEDFDWRLNEQYALIHSLQPACLIGNNHHLPVFDGEDIQIFEHDLPGENKMGFSANSEVSTILPLETCGTMNNNWGYNVWDNNYKDHRTIVHYLVRAAGHGANLLLNVGPRPDGRIPEQALDGLRQLGDWLSVNGETIYATTAGDFKPTEWGASTRKGDKLFVHVLDTQSTELTFHCNGKVKSVVDFASREPVAYTHNKKEGTVSVTLPALPTVPDFILEVITK